MESKFTFRSSESPPVENRSLKPNLLGSLAERVLMASELVGSRIGIVHFASFVTLAGIGTGASIARALVRYLITSGTYRLESLSYCSTRVQQKAPIPRSLRD